MAGKVQLDARAGTGTTQAHPLAATGGGANCALILKIWLSTSTAPTTIVDSAGGSLAGGQWVLISSVAATATFVYARFSAPAGITSVTPSFGSGTYHSVVIEYDDVSGSETIAAAEAAAQTAPSSGATGTLSQASERILGFFDTCSGGAQSFAAGATYTAETGTGLTAGAWGTGSTQAFMESKTVAATTAVSATATCTSSYVYSVCVPLKLAAGGGGGGSSSSAILLL